MQATSTVLAPGRTTALACAVASAVGTAAAIAVLPWAYYGSIEMPIFRFPGWGWYVAAAVVFHATVLWRLMAPARRLGLVAGVVAGLLTIASAVVVASEYDEPSNFFDGIYPAVGPAVGPGAHIAVISAVVGIIGVVSARPTPASTPGGPTPLPSAGSRDGTGR